MKSLFRVALTAILLLCAVSVVSAKELVTITFVTDINCEKCVAKVMNILPFQRGVKDVEVDLKSKSINVKYDTSKISNEEIIKTLKKLDIEAQE